ncbi:MAG: RNA polymerase sigma factor [Actinobacteria bacterium]|nr:RNA polymerase sigma factor [Actinomycetota bacterium]
MTGKREEPTPGSEQVTPPSAPPADTRAVAFAEHVEPELEVMLRVAMSLTGRRADAEDLVQESVLRAFKALDRFDGRHPRAWLLTIVRHTHLNMHRRRRPDTLADWDALGDPRPAFGANRQASAEDTVLDAALDHRLRGAVAELDPRFRAVLLLVDVQDLSYAEAAATLGIPVGTVMSRLSRARDRVRKRLGPQTLISGGPR